MKKISEETKIGIVTARFNSEITDSLREGAIFALKQWGVKESQICSISVPGAAEIPLAAKWLIEDSGVHGVIALGAVIRGDTYHFESVCGLVDQGCLQVQLQSNRPVSQGVLMTYTEEQAQVRSKKSGVPAASGENAAAPGPGEASLHQSGARGSGYNGNKGAEAAEALLQMLELKSLAVTGGLTSE